MLLEIVQVGHPVLRQRARSLAPSEIASKEIQKLIQSMRETMYDAPGVGLAAPQVGLSLQLAVIEDKSAYHKDVDAAQLRERERKPVPFHVLINPQIISPAIPAPGGQAQTETAEFFEGCLSLSGFTALVPRSRTVDVECLDEQGRRRVIRASGWYARILQHEIDHLQGTLYIDRMFPRTFASLENWTEYCKGKPVSDIAR